MQYVYATRNAFVLRSPPFIAQRNVCAIILLKAWRYSYVSCPSQELRFQAVLELLQGNSASVVSAQYGMRCEVQWNENVR